MLSKPHEVCGSGLLVCAVCHADRPDGLYATGFELHFVIVFLVHLKINIAAHLPP